jgi:hypothetical protein
LSTDQAVQSEFSLLRSAPHFTGSLCFKFLLILSLLRLTAAQLAYCQDAVTPAGLNAQAEVTGTADAIPPAGMNLLSETHVPSESLVPPEKDAVIESEGMATAITRSKEPVESELLIEGLYSYGNYKIFASGWDMKLFTAGVEYDRHSWGYFLKARVDYVAEFLPLVLLDKPVNEDIWGYPLPYPSGKYNREYVPGIGISPIGFRMQWRSKKAIKPYLEAKGGVLVFTQKVPSNEATYESFSLQSATGVQVKMNDRWGLRLGLFSDFHFSDDFIVPVNPGLDVMNANLALVYHFGTRNQ